MRVHLTIAAIAGMLLTGAGAASAFDGTRTPAGQPAPTLMPGATAPAAAGIVSAPLPPLPGVIAPAAAALPRLPTPLESFRSGAQALRAGETAKGITALQYAADQGHAAAQWKLGRMYADGEGVAQDDVKAFEFFSRIANGFADENPATPQSRFVANAFVALGNYYLDGIPNSPVKVDKPRARDMFQYAASYFGDADAQYHLARMLLDGSAGPRDARQAARWLGLAANKGQVQAQAVLGQMLFVGRDVPRQAARGLMWLGLARESAAKDDKWIVETHEAALRQSSEDERSMALILTERFVRSRTQ
jgi:TPR repeat protein